MAAYHSDPSLKSHMLAEMAEHRAAERLVKGTYGSGSNGDWRGCAVGCGVRTLNAKLGKRMPYGDHAAYSECLGIPQYLSRLEDAIFEGLPIDDAMAWPERFLGAIQPGSDLDMVWPRFALWLMREFGLLDIPNVNCDVINYVGDLYGEWVETGVSPSADRWCAAATAADAAWRAADADAAWRAAATAAATAADAAWRAAATAAATATAADAAWRAADAAWRAADAAAAARSVAWTRIADKLIELLAAAAIPVTA